MTGESVTPTPGNGVGESSPPHETETFGLKEVLRMLAETNAQDAEVLRIIDDTLLEPIPLNDDEEGWLLYREKMAALAAFAATLDGSTARSREIKRKIEERLAEYE